MDERKLLRRLSRGDDEALDAIIDRYSAYIYAIVSNVLHGQLGQEDMEEAVSDVFFSLWNHRKEVQPISLRAYLAAIARNTAKNKLRSLKLTVPLEDEVLSVRVPENSMDASMLKKELCAQVRGAVEELEEPDREIFLRYYYCYQKVSEIAERMNMNEPAVRTRLHRGRKKLQARLAERGYLDEYTDF